jgi:hypothetical protein
VGKLHYGDAEFEFDDWSLAHLQVIISTKLRRAENFFLSWDEPSQPPDNEGVAIWIDNGVPIYFQYSSAKQAPINRQWLEKLATQSTSSSGIHLTGKAVPKES